MRQASWYKKAGSWTSGKPRWAQDRETDLGLSLDRHPELRGCRVLRTLGNALQARDELARSGTPCAKPGRNSYPDSVEFGRMMKVSSATNADNEPKLRVCTFRQ
jgi:hypothetical protein